MRFEFLRWSRGFLVAGLLLASLPAEAALIPFTDRTTFESATTGATHVTFENIVPAESAASFENPDGLNTGGITFRTSGTGSTVVSVYGGDLAAQSAMLNTGTGAILAWAPPDRLGTEYLDVVLPIGITAFAADVWAQQPSVTTVNMTVNSGEATENFSVDTMERPSPSFFGVHSDGNVLLLVRIAIPAGQVGLILDNVSIGTAGGGGDNTIPEPGTIILLGAGMVGLVAVRRWKYT
jgi:hypothetical protein